MKLILLAIALGSDSFVVGLVDGCFGVCRASKRRMAILFVLYDGAAAAVGLLSGGRTSQFEQLYDAISLASWLILALLVVERLVGGAARPRRSPDHLLPLLFCIDNLAAGPVLANIGVAPAVCIGLIGAASGSLFFVGASCGQGVAARLRRGCLELFSGVRTRPYADRLSNLP